jgi:hypothetical protein
MEIIKLLVYLASILTLGFFFIYFSNKGRQNVIFKIAIFVIFAAGVVGGVHFIKTESLNFSAYHSIPVIGSSALSLWYSFAKQVTKLLKFIFILGITAGLIYFYL